MTPPTILGIGAAFVDTILFVDDSFLSRHGMEKGSVVAIDNDHLHKLVKEADGNVRHFPGGSCANVIRALAKLGFSCSLTGKIGNDEASAFLLDNLLEYQISGHYIPSQLPTGRVLCFVTPDAERTMRDMLGASAAMRGSDLDPQLFCGRQLVHIEGYTLFNGDLAEEAMRLGAAAGAMISFDLANFKVVQQHRNTLRRLIDNYVDIAFANAQEAEELTGLAPEEACRWLSQYCAYAVVTMGAKGCWAAQGGEMVHIPATPPPRIVDTTGAGDLFSAGFLYGIMTNRPLEESAKLGRLLATRVIEIEGACLPDSVWNNILSMVYGVGDDSTDSFND